MPENADKMFSTTPGLPTTPGFSEANPSFSGAGSAPPLAQAIDNREEVRLRAEKLVRHLTKNNIHPVLVFGTTASGKTTALQSLLNYPETDGDANIEIGLASDAFPPDYPNAKARQEDAKAFVNSSLKAFSAEKLPPPTQKAYPFFVPVNVTFRKPDTKEKKATLAFLEGMGEQFEKQPSGTEYKPLPEEVEAVISLFTRPISVIFVAPCDFGGDQALHAYSHECLSNVMEEYRTKRVNKSHDYLLLLAAKWDASHPPDDPSRRFSNATPKEIYNTVQTWTSWVKFRSLSGFDHKHILPYAAGWIRKNTIIEQGPYKPVFDQFNRTLWDWLYGNIPHDSERGSSSSLNGSAEKKREHFYDDVSIEEDKGPGLYYSITRFALWVTPIVRRN